MTLDTAHGIVYIVVNPWFATEVDGECRYLRVEQAVSRVSTGSR